MRKKMLLVVCSVILCISIIGCGASKEKENNSIQSVIEDNSIEEVTETNTIISPLPVTIDINNLDNCTVAVSLEQGDAYVRKIRECNDAIPGEEISEKISRIENIVDKIFDRVEQNPDSVSDIRKLMDYYLPTPVKLLEAYAEMDAQPVGGENIHTAKREIDATLDTLIVALEKLLDSLFQDTAWDVSSDISVLNTMLAQEGLKDDGLKNS